MLTVGAGGVCLDIYLSSFISLFFLPLSVSMRRRNILTETLSTRAVNLKTTDQPTHTSPCDFRILDSLLARSCMCVSVYEQQYESPMVLRIIT